MKRFLLRPSSSVRGCIVLICVKEELGSSSWVRRLWRHHSDFGFTFLGRAWPLALAWPILAQQFRPDGQTLCVVGALQLLVDCSHLVVLHMVGADSLPEEAGVQLSPCVAEPNVVLRSDACLPRQQAGDVDVFQVE